MLFGDSKHNKWVQTSLHYLPDEVFEEIRGKVAFTNLASDACRLASKVCKFEEIIIFSPWILPDAFFTETDKVAKYFIFCVLHEIAHVYLKHDPPNELTLGDNQKQENEADNLAMEWFNKHATNNASKGLNTITIGEIRAQEEINRNKVLSIIEKD